MSLISVDLIVVYWSVLHLILDSTWVWYSLLLELKIPTLSLDYEMHWHCEDNGTHLVILFVWEFCDEMFRYCEDNTYIIVIVTYGSYTWSYGVHFIVPEKTLVISMRTTLFWEDFGLHCGLAITVVERLQRYNCIWLTYIDNVGQNILFYIEVGSCEMLSLCGKLDLEKEHCVLTMFCIQKKVVQIPCVNHFVLEKLVSLWLMSWLFTFGWEPVWFENFWKCFDVFEFI